MKCQVIFFPEKKIRKSSTINLVSTSVITTIWANSAEDSFIHVILLFSQKTGGPFFQRPGI